MPYVVARYAHLQVFIVFILRFHDLIMHTNTLRIHVYVSCHVSHATSQAYLHAFFQANRIHIVFIS